MGTYLACEDRTVRPAQLIFLPLPGDFTIAPIDRGPFIPIWDNPLVWPIERVSETQIKFDRANTPETVLKQAEFDLNFRARSTTLCPDGLCGFVGKPSVERCVNKPDATSCRRLVATCDPRSKAGVNHCGRPTADVREQGVHVLWADGAEVVLAKGVTIMRPSVKTPVLDTKMQAAIDRDHKLAARLKGSQYKADRFTGKQRKPIGSRLSKGELTKLQGNPIGPLSGRDLRWRTLKKGERLQAGDLVNVPLNSQLTLRYKGHEFGSGKPIEQTYDGRAKRHLLSITGPSARHLLAAPTKRGALSPAQLQKAMVSGEFESRAPTKKQWARLQRLSVKPESMYVPSLKELHKEAEAYDEQHILDHPRFTPEGTDRKYEKTSK
jgi:hypothetical protein